MGAATLMVMLVAAVLMGENWPDRILLALLVLGAFALGGETALRHERRRRGVTQP